MPAPIPDEQYRMAKIAPDIDGENDDPITQQHRTLPSIRLFPRDDTETVAAAQQTVAGAGN
jgi:hypothetical protein